MIDACRSFWIQHCPPDVQNRRRQNQANLLLVHVIRFTPTFIYMVRSIFSLSNDVIFVHLFCWYCYIYLYHWKHLSLSFLPFCCCFYLFGICSVLPIPTCFWYSIFTFYTFFFLYIFTFYATAVWYFCSVLLLLFCCSFSFLSAPTEGQAVIVVWIATMKSSTRLGAWPFDDLATECKYKATRSGLYEEMHLTSYGTAAARTGTGWFIVRWRGIGF